MPKPGYHVHHIDWNHANDHPSNRIEIPECVHRVIHSCGVSERWEIERLVRIYELSKQHSMNEIQAMIDDGRIDSLPAHHLHALMTIPHPTARSSKQPKTPGGQLTLDL